MGLRRAPQSRRVCVSCTTMTFALRCAHKPVEIISLHNGYCCTNGSFKSSFIGSATAWIVIVLVITEDCISRAQYAVRLGHEPQTRFCLLVYGAPRRSVEKRTDDKSAAVSSADRVTHCCSQIGA